jgi:hypothetical protein
MPKRNDSLLPASSGGRSKRSLRRDGRIVALVRRPLAIVGVLLAMTASANAEVASRTSVAALNHALGMDTYWGKVYEFGIGAGMLAEFNRSIDATQRSCVKVEFGKGMDAHATSSLIKTLGETGQHDVDAWMTFLATPAGQWFAGVYSSHLEGVLVASNAQALTSGGTPVTPAIPTPPRSHRRSLQTFFSTPEGERFLASVGSLTDPSEAYLRRVMKGIEATCGVKFEAPNY